MERTSETRNLSLAIPLALAAALLLLGPWTRTCAFAQTREARTPEAEKKEPPAFDTGAAPTTRIPLAPGLNVGARVDLEYQREDNFDLNKAAADDKWFWEPRLRLALSYAPTPMFTLLFDVETARRMVDDERNRAQNETRLELKQAYLSINEPVKGLTVQLGRIRFKDPREWLYDEELDGGRIFYTFSKYAVEASVSQKNDRDFLHGGDSAQDDATTDESVTNFVLIGKYLPIRDIEIHAYGFLRDDRTLANESPLFLGIHSHGEPFQNFQYWLEAALVRGESGTRDIEGAGFDVGFTYELRGALRYNATIGYAFGSGDDNPNDGKDKSFRQTGFQENEDKVGGIRRIQYYGELLDPELSNLHILTTGAGIRTLKKHCSLEFLYHLYRQDKVSRNLSVAGRDTTELNVDPNRGSVQDKDLGQEFDVVAAYRGEHIRTKLALGWFDPGDAFVRVINNIPRDADRAFFAEFKLTYEF